MISLFRMFSYLCSSLLNKKMLCYVMYTNRVNPQDEFHLADELCSTVS